MDVGLGAVVAGQGDDARAALCDLVDDGGDIALPDGPPRPVLQAEHGLGDERDSAMLPDMRALRLGMIVGPAVVLAAVGVTHPHHLTPHTAAYWARLHTLLLPVFPLLGVSVWLLLAGTTGPLEWAARVAAYGYAAFYTALDLLAGVAAGTLVRRFSGQGVTAETPQVQALFEVGNDLGDIGSWCFLLACVLVLVVLLRRSGPAVLPGGALLVGGAIGFMNNHIYWPGGVVSMVALAVGFGWLAVVTERRRKGALHD